MPTSPQFERLWPRPWPTSLTRLNWLVSRADAVSQAWRLADPTLSVKIVRGHTVRTDLQGAWEIDQALTSAVDREIARAVEQQE